MLTKQRNSVFWHFLRSRLTIIRRGLLGSIIDSCVWAGSCTFVSGYLMQSLGVSSSYGLFFLGGAIASAGLFDLYGNVTNLVTDFENAKSIFFYILTPSTRYVVFASLACSYLFVGLLTTLVFIPIGKLILWDTFVWANVNWPQLLTVIVCANLFYATFTIATTAMIKRSSNMNHLWTRIIFPLWFFGGLQFSWNTLYKLCPIAAYISLLNPIMYTTEGVRAALFGSADYFPWWISCLMLGVFSALAWWYGTRTLKKFLDLV